jgi:hypothetical protein
MSERIVTALSSVARWFIFKPKIQIWVKVWKVLKWKTLAFFMAMLSILRPNGIHLLLPFCVHLVYFSHFGMLYREQFGNPGARESPQYMCTTVSPCDIIFFNLFNLLDVQKSAKLHAPEKEEENQSLEEDFFVGSRDEEQSGDFHETTLRP